MLPPVAGGGPVVLPTWPLPGGEATAPLRGGLRCGLARTRPDRCSYYGFRRSIHKPITAPWPLFSPAPCRAVVRGGAGRAWGTPRAHRQHHRTVLFRASGAESLLDQQCGHSRSRTTAARLPPWSSRYTVQFSLPLRARLSMPSSRQGPIAKAAIRAAWSFCANGETHFNLAQDKMYKHDGIRIKGATRTSTSSTSSASSGSTGA